MCATRWRWLVAGCQTLPRSSNARGCPRSCDERRGCSHDLPDGHDSYALLGKVGSADPASVQYLRIISNPLTWVQSVELCTAKVTKRALEIVTTPSQMCSALPLRTRLATCDKASSNLACEKAIRKDRGDSGRTCCCRATPTATPRRRRWWPMTSKGCSTWPWRVG